MDKTSISRISFKGLFLIGALAALSACASKTPIEEATPKTTITEEELTAYCPSINVTDDGAYYNNYTRGGDGDSSKVIYQAAIRDITRACQYPGGNLNIKVAAAGRVVPGPQFKAGNITMPIRVTVIRGTDVVYSKLHKYSVQITNTASATQFIFIDDQVSIPRPSQKNVRIFVGFEAGAKK